MLCIFEVMHHIYRKRKEGGHAEGKRMQEYRMGKSFADFAGKNAKKFHKKQIEIAIRSGKPIPKYLEQNRELNRR